MCITTILLCSLGSKSYAESPLIADIEIVVDLGSGVDDPVLGSIQIEQLPKEQQGFFKNRKHLKSKVKIAREELKQLHQKAKELYGEHVKLRIRASLSKGSLREEVFQIRSSSSSADEDSENPSKSQPEIQNTDSLNGDMDERLYLLAKKVSKGFTPVDIQHKFKPVQKWYAYLAAKLGIPVHDVFYGFTAAAIIGLTVYQVNHHNLEVIANSDFKLSVSKDFLIGAMTAWSSLFEASTVLFTSFYIHWVNKGNLLINRMKVSCLYLSVPVIIAFSVGLPMNDNANSLYELMQNSLVKIGASELNTSVGEFSARFLDGLWRAFIYVAPTHLVFKSLGRTKNNVLRSAGNLLAVVAANIAAFVGIYGSQDGYSLEDMELWVKGKLSMQDFATSLSQYLPEWIAHTKMSTSNIMVALIGTAGLIGYSRILYKDWKNKQEEKDSTQKKSFLGWIKSFFRKSPPKTQDDCHDGFL